MKTCALIKPDAVNKKLIGKIITLIEDMDLTIVNIKKMKMHESFAKRFYIVHEQKPFYNELVEYMCSGPIIALELEHENAIHEWRKLVDKIREIYAESISINCVHGSDSVENAEYELSLISF